MNLNLISNFCVIKKETVFLTDMNLVFFFFHLSSPQSNKKSILSNPNDNELQKPKTKTVCEKWFPEKQKQKSKTFFQTKI